MDIIRHFLQRVKTVRRMHRLEHCRQRRILRIYEVLQRVEVTLRNAVHRRLLGTYGDEGSSAPRAGSATPVEGSAKKASCMAASFTARTRLLRPHREEAPAGLWKASVQRVRLISGSCATAAHIRPSSRNRPFKAKMFSWLSKKRSGPSASYVRAAPALVRALSSRRSIGAKAALTVM